MTKPIQDIIDGLEHTKSETEEHIGPLHASKIQDAIDALKAMQWVPIADIPEEWKDGTPLDLIVNIEGDEAHRMTACANYFDVWYDWNGFEILNTVTHAMLPPQPPLVKPE